MNNDVSRIEPSQYSPVKDSAGLVRPRPFITVQQVHRFPIGRDLAGREQVRVALATPSGARKGEVSSASDVRPLFRVSELESVVLVAVVRAEVVRQVIRQRQGTGERETTPKWGGGIGGQCLAVLADKLVDAGDRGGPIGVTARERGERSHQSEQLRQGVNPSHDCSP